jgi:aryl-alcohol dehydrogenase-like predicted oxidoreductase
MRLESVDLYLLHGYIVCEAAEGGERRTPAAVFRDAVRPAFERLVEQGRIGAWGITAIGMPSAVLAILGENPPPRAVQAVTNPLDSPGEMKWFNEPARAREIIAAGHDRDIGVMGIRVVGGGALTDTVDRELPADNPIMADFRRAEPLRQLARELGESSASLAHRYALSIMTSLVLHQPEVAVWLVGVAPPTYDRADGNRTEVVMGRGTLSGLWSRLSP